jgi:hypothetical protein
MQLARMRNDSSYLLQEKFDTNVNLWKTMVDALLAPNSIIHEFILHGNV